MTVTTQLRAIRLVVQDPEQAGRDLATAIPVWLPLALFPCLAFALGYVDGASARRVAATDPALAAMWAAWTDSPRLALAFQLSVGASAAIGFLVRIAATGAAIWLAGAVARLTLPFRRTFAIALYSGTIVLLHDATRTAIRWARSAQALTVDQLRPATGLDLIVHEVSGPARELLSAINPFDAWQVAVIAGGIRACTGTSWRRAAFVALAFWMVATAGQALFISVTQR